MKTKMLNGAILMLFALAPFGAAQAAEQESACRLRGGSIVPLPAEACAKEGGAMVTVTIAAPAAAAPAVSAPAAPAPAAAASAPAAIPAPVLSADPRRAAAQKAIIELLGKPVVSKSSHRHGPESIERSAKFAECTMTVEENTHLDYGNLISSRMDFKISSTVRFGGLRPEEVGVLGETSSKGGDLETYSVYLARPARDGGDFSISVSVRDGKQYRKFTSPGSSAYWAGPRDDYWMADEYGYPTADDLGNIYTNKVRILYVVGTEDDANALKKAFDEMRAACAPQR